MRDLVDIATATSPGVRVATRILLAFAATISLAAMAAIVFDQQAMDRAEIALWTVSGPPCQRIRPVALESLEVGSDPGPLTFEEAQGAFVHGGVVCSEINHDHGGQTDQFTVCQFGSPYVIRLDTPHGEVFFKTPAGQSATISFAGENLAACWVRTSRQRSSIARANRSRPPERQILIAAPTSGAAASGHPANRQVRPKADVGALKAPRPPFRLRKAGPLV